MDDLTLEPDTTSIKTKFNANNVSPTIFNITNPNSCISFSTSTISFELADKATATIASTFSIQSWFKYIYPRTDTTLRLPTKRLNSLHISFTNDKYPVLISCALLCNTNSTALNESINLYSNLHYVNEPLFSGFSKYLNLDANQEDVYINNLSRGEEYKLNCKLQSAQVDQKSRSNYTSNVIFTDATTNLEVPLKVLEPDNSVCFEFSFKAKPATTILNKILNTCQWTFSPLNGVTTGCMSCVEYDTLKAVPGKELKESNVCPLIFVNKTITSTRVRNLNINNYFNSQTFNRLKKFQGGQVVSNTNNINNNLQIRKLTTTNTTTTTIATYNYKICAVQQKTCSEDLSGTKRPLDYINDLINLLKLDSSISSNLINIVIIEDKSAPDVSNLNPYIASFVPQGAYSVSLKTNNTNPMRCYWRINNSTITKPSVIEIKNCVSDWCGSSVIKAPEGEFLNSNNLTNFTYGNYTMWYTCYNDVVNPNWPTNVTSAYNYTQDVKCFSGGNEFNGTCVVCEGIFNSTSGKCTNNSTDSSSFGMFVMLWGKGIVILLIFIFVD